MRYAARFGFEAALAVLDTNEKVPWSQSLLDELTFDHFGDGKQPTISDPASANSIRVDAYRYNDGSGFAVDHDVALDGKRSDFTAQFDFRKSPNGYRVYLDDIHVL